jgi:hypothetical protein
LDLADLHERGWMRVEGVSSQEDLLDLGMALGTCERTPNGEIVKEIRRIPKDEAPPGSQSALYGAGPFPLHTDTVFWTLPVRYVLLRGYGDTRRPTTVISFRDLLEGADPRLRAAIGESVWRVSVGSTSFYCSMRFRHDDTEGWRYDADLMIPANKSAEQVAEGMRPLVGTDAAEPIRWSGDEALVLANWVALHGRGHQPDNEGERVIERLYAR